MTTSRRRFLKSGAMIALAAGVPLSLDKIVLGQRLAGGASGAADGFQLPAKGDPLLSLRKSSFEPYVNSIFEVRVSKGAFVRSVPLTLVSVSETRMLRKVSKSGGIVPADIASGQSFSLLFRGSLATPLKQDTQDIQHYALGKMRLLMVPVGHEDKSACYYEVIFNRAHG